MSDSPIATSSQTVGPFFHFGLAPNDALGRMAGPEAPGDHIRLRVQVTDGQGKPVPDALVELYQADAAGRYSETTTGNAPPFTGFGRLPTGPDGWCEFSTIKPGAVTTRQGRQAPHVNVCLLSRGLLRHVYTRIYFGGDPELATDSLFAIVPEQRRHTLLARADTSAPGVWTFVIRLQGDNETVFFDL